MNRNLSEKMIKVNEAAIRDEQYRMLMEEHKEQNIRFQAIVDGLSRENREIIFDYFGIVMEMQNRLLMILLQLE